MTEYDYSPEAYERYRATQNRIANWVDNTEQHRGEFQSGNAALPDLPRSGPGPVSHPKSRKRSSPSPPRRGQSHLVIHPPPPGSDSSDSYYQGPWPAQIPHQGPVMGLPQQPGFHPMQPLLPPPPMVMPPTYVTSPDRVSHHHRHRSHDHPRSRSHQSPAYYASPPLATGYPYPYTVGYPGYRMMQQYGGSQAPIMYLRLC